MVKRGHHDVRGSTKRGSAGPSSTLAAHQHLQIVYLPVERLRPSPNNARTHSRNS